MGTSGYTSLSIEQNRYNKLRKDWDANIDSEYTFTVWAMDTMENAIKREMKLKKKFPGFKFVGTKTNGAVVEDNGEIIIVDSEKDSLKCSKDKGLCKHIMFATMHPSFL